MTWIETVFPGWPVSEFAVTATVFTKLTVTARAFTKSIETFTGAAYLCYSYADVVRGLTFDADDANSIPIRHSVRASEAAGSSTASASARRFHRSVSFSAHPQVLEVKDSSQEAKADEEHSNEGQEPFDESNLPDGITAIAVADPNDPSVMVMQVGTICSMHVSGELLNVYTFCNNSKADLCKLCLQLPTSPACILLVTACPTACMTKLFQGAAEMHS